MNVGLCVKMINEKAYVCLDTVSQGGGRSFVYRDHVGWPVSLPYIRKIRVSVAIHTQSGIRLNERVPIVKILNGQNLTTGKLFSLFVVVVLLLHFRPVYLNNQKELRNEILCTHRYL